MPRISLPLLIALLLGGVARGDDVVLDGRSDPEYLSESPADAPTAVRRLPIRLVKRSEHPKPPGAGAPRGEPIPIPAAGNQNTSDGRKPLERTTSTAGSVTTVVLSSLAIVLGLFFLLVWLARRAFPKASASLPTDVLEVLGRAPMASRHNLQLIRLGRRLLLISVTAEGAKSLTEITDPDEVNHLLGLCRQNQQGSITGTFRQVLHQLGTQQPSRPRSARTPSDVGEFSTPGTNRQG